MKHHRQQVEVSADGFQRPRYDLCLRQVDDWVADVATALVYCGRRRVAVQAGGAYGVWPIALAKADFEWVYTFEPDPLNFTCLAANAGFDNCVRIQAALGASVGTCTIKRDDFEFNNAGAGYVVAGAGFVGGIPVMPLDAFKLDNVDLLCLDVEGYEYAAVVGARDTIRRCRPTIMLEAKALPQMMGFGVTAETAINYLEALGYKQVATVHRDIVMVPA